MPGVWINGQIYVQYPKNPEVGDVVDTGDELVVIENVVVMAKTAEFTCTARSAAGNASGKSAKAPHAVKRS